MILKTKVKWSRLVLLVASLFSVTATIGCAQTGTVAQNMSTNYNNIMNKVQGFSLAEEQKLLTDHQTAFDNYKSTRLFSNDESADETTEKISKTE